MNPVFKQLRFWRKFSRFLLVGLSSLILLYFFQVEPITLSAQTNNCPALGLPVIIEPVNSASLVHGTKDVTLRWNAVTGAQYYEVFLKKASNSEGVYGPVDITGTQVTISGRLQDGIAYSWYVLPKSNCGPTTGEVAVAKFSVTAAPIQTCSNQPVLCSGNEDGGGTYVYPDPNNNCQITCPGRSVGQLSCNIAQSLVGPYNNGYQYDLSAQSTSSYSAPLTYGWDFTNDGSIDNYGSSVRQSFYGNTSVRLRITDSAGRFGDCYTNINLPSSQQPGYGTVPVCTITAYPSNNISAGTNVTFTGNGTAYNGKFINSYQWDFDNNGAYDTGASSNRNASYTFHYPQTVRLRVIDSAGLANDCTTYINIGNNYPPGSCTQERITCPDGSTVGRNPNNSCQFDACPVINQCRNIQCPQAPSGCYYSGAVTSTCNPNVGLTCGNLICPQPTLPNTPSIPAIPNIDNANIQQTIVDIVNENINVNNNTNNNTSNSSSQSSATGGYSYSAGGYGGSSTVNIQ